MSQGSKVGVTSGGGRGGDWSPGSQLTPVQPDSPSSSHGGREVRGDSCVYRALPGNPLGPGEATEAQSSVGQESGVGWGLRHRTEAAEGQGAATEHGRETGRAPRHLGSPRSLQEPPSLSPCLPVGPVCSGPRLERSRETQRQAIHTLRGSHLLEKSQRLPGSVEPCTPTLAPSLTPSPRLSANTFQTHWPPCCVPNTRLQSLFSFHLDCSHSSLRSAPKCHLRVEFSDHYPITPHP